MTRRGSTGPAAVGRVGLALIVILGGCAKVKHNDPRQTEGAKVETKQHKAACASSAAYARLKDMIFDRAVSERAGDRTNLNTLSDYSTIRMDDPVVAGFDPSLDMTRCRGRLILEIPPGAERGFAGERRLQTDVDYTAQAAADGSGLVYQLAGAEPIIAKLAAFNLTSVAFRPPPAIDEPQVEGAEPGPAELAQADAPAQSAPAAERQAAPRSGDAIGGPGDQADAGPSGRWPAAAGGIGGEATVRAFYQALGAGRGAAASVQVIPEKRTGGAFSPDALSRFYGQLPEPIRLTEIVPLNREAYRVRYRYSAGRSRCEGSAVVRLTNRGGRDFIRSIRALNGC